jgi:hypothetical protein
MKMSFMPGDLHVEREVNGEYVVRLAGTQILRTSSEKAALSRFKALRTEMETKFPTREPTQQEREELCRHAIADSLVGQNSLGGRKKKTSAGGTRTFGG